MTPRSWLFVPGDRPDRMDKACATRTHAIILDLEDSVAEPNKAAARALTSDFLSRNRDAAGPQLWVRINPLSTEAAIADLAAIIPFGPAGIVLPKADSGAAILEFDHYLTAIEVVAGRARGATRILPITMETPQAILNANSYSKTGERIAALTWGAEDLLGAIGAATHREQDGAFTPLHEVARALCLAGAAATGVAAIESVYADFRDLDGLRAYAGRASRHGFWGMLAIHPSQVDVINEAFAPSDAEIESARRVVAAFATSLGAGAIALDGTMLDAPHLKRSKRIMESLGDSSGSIPIPGLHGI